MRRLPVMFGYRSPYQTKYLLTGLYKLSKPYKLNDKLCIIPFGQKIVTRYKPIILYDENNFHVITVGLLAPQCVGLVTDGHIKGEKTVTCYGA